jgi:outer membrane protein with beta-barrel domain
MRALGMFALAAVLSSSIAFAQETTGAGRTEISAFPGGGVFFGSSSTETEPNFGNYTVGAAFTFNFNRWVGVEGEVGNAIGLKQNVNFNGAALTSQETPHFFAYNANAVINPIGNDRPFVPYVTGGLGGLRMIQTDEVANLGVTAATNYLTGNVGGGLKWFATRHWGARGDYRLMIVNDNTNAPLFFGREEIRYGHRVYGGLLFTY